MCQRIAMVPVLLLVVLGTACATSLPLRTSSGRPEIAVSGNDRQLLASVLTENMLAAHFQPMLINDRLAVYERPVGGMDALVLAPGFTSDANLRVTCCFLEEGAGIHLATDLEIVSDSGTPEERRKGIPRGHQLAHDVQDVLELTKGSFALRLHEMAWPEDDVTPDGPAVWTGN